MAQKIGTIFSIAQDNPPVPGCTVSSIVHAAETGSVLYFSLAPQTDISAETYGYHKLIHVESGALSVFTHTGEHWDVSEGQVILTPTDIPVGMRSTEGCVYTEIEIRKESAMNDVLKPGEVLKLADLLPYQEGKIVNMDLAHNDTMKFVLMSFDAGCGLSEHSAPGEALIFALDGEGIIGYEGQEHVIKAGENFKFAKNGKHYVKAEKPFKMGLLLLLSE